MTYHLDQDLALLRSIHSAVRSYTQPQRYGNPILIAIERLTELLPSGTMPLKDRPMPTLEDAYGLVVLEWCYLHAKIAIHPMDIERTVRLIDEALIEMDSVLSDAHLDDDEVDE